MRVAIPDLLRLLRRKGIDTGMQDYVMRVHIFGKIGLPCAVNWALKRTTPLRMRIIISKRELVRKFFI